MDIEFVSMPGSDAFEVDVSPGNGKLQPIGQAASRSDLPRIVSSNVL